MTISKQFEPCQFGTRVSTCYHTPRCGYMRPGDHASPFGRYTPDPEAQAQYDAMGDIAAACERTVAPGQCTGCEQDSPELIPWSSQRLCWACVDLQLDLMALAIGELVAA